MDKHFIWRSGSLGMFLFVVPEFPVRQNSEIINWVQNAGFRCCAQKRGEVPPFPVYRMGSIAVYKYELIKWRI